MFSTLLSAVLAAVALAAQTNAEYHTIRFYNACGFGTPTLLANGDVLSTGEDYTSDGPFSSAIAYLQNGNQCGYNGEHCTLMEMTMSNPTCAGCGSSVDLSLIDPHSFSYWTSFAYFNGCENTGANCPAAGCAAAFYYSDETQVQVACQADNAGLLIAFCADATTLDANNLPGTSPSSSSEHPRLAAPTLPRLRPGQAHRLMSPRPRRPFLHSRARSLAPPLLRLHPLRSALLATPSAPFASTRSVRLLLSLLPMWRRSATTLTAPATKVLHVTGVPRLP
ncbi:uncharacterized protein B0H18DRAFT_418045 [Fomitopsis serialis]|uniref:uncharacterized protein n=1 Tax=Fomitopsis serialis TaxID=139415 RepID=UPI0020078C4F|nr:uncharacterized protein B0H18DRAFT_418045 [Neoantrodia serialis]KAH9935598.1 hypothetical protein B0H18DRAFT_418045 [Neoantrodia serialis]